METAVYRRLGESLRQETAWLGLGLGLGLG